MHIKNNTFVFLRVASDNLSRFLFLRQKSFLSKDKNLICVSYVAQVLIVDLFSLIFYVNVFSPRANFLDKILNSFLILNWDQSS